MIRQIIVNAILQTCNIVGQTFSPEMQLGALRLQILICPVIDVEVVTKIHFLLMLLTKTKICTGPVLCLSDIGS